MKVYDIKDIPKGYAISRLAIERDGVIDLSLTNYSYPAYNEKVVYILVPVNKDVPVI